MRNAMLLCVLAIGLLLSGSAAAQDIKGSDTLEVLTQEVLANCPGTESLTYIGGGSSSGEQAMVDGAQEVAPMSRFLRSGRSCQVNGGGTAEGLAHSLDGLSIIAADSAVAASCDGVAFTGSLAIDAAANGQAGLQCPGCTGSTYTLGGPESEPWQDALRVIYGGLHNEDTADCNSDVRAALLNNWSNLFEGAACDSDDCDRLEHVWRRADLSGTTDTFLSLLGLPGVGDVPFCNGTDLQDLDPIRRDCDPSEQVCQSDGTLGALLPIFVPEGEDLSIAYNANECAQGVFSFELAPFGVQDCPNNTSTLFGQCLTPRDANGDAGCLNQDFNLPAFSDLSLDGRVYNLILRDAGGDIVLDANSRELTGSYYRIHTTTAKTAGATPCTEQSATLQIGCLAQANACSVGFAGREGADLIAGASSLEVNGRLPTDENVRLLLTPEQEPATYPLARLLWFNSLVGFANVTDAAQAALAACFQDRAIVDAAATAAGFITLDDTGALPVQLVDFDERSCNPLASYQSGHADVAFEFDPAAGEFEVILEVDSIVLDGVEISGGALPIADIGIETDAVFTRPTGDFGFFEPLCVAEGESLFWLPQGNTEASAAGVPFMGIAAEVAPGLFVDNRLNLQLVSVAGPGGTGNYSLWKDGFPPSFSMSSCDGISAADTLPLAIGHDHFNMGFAGTPGRWTVRYRVSGELVSDGSTPSAEFDLTYDIGN